MKLSELTYEKVGRKEFNMHYDASDALRLISCDWAFDEVKKQLMEKYGDVEISIHPDAPWFSFITIDDERWKKDHADYCRVKQEWCNKWGCD